jgi:hypothetical protein
VSSFAQNESVAFANSQSVYYRLYTRGGETISRRAFDPRDRAVGRLDVNHITPPHTAAALRRCIAKIEDNPRYICGTLYTNNSSNVAIPDGAYIPALSSPTAARLGTSERNPLVLVEQERRQGVFNRPLQCMVSVDRRSVQTSKLSCCSSFMLMRRVT